MDYKDADSLSSKIFALIASATVLIIAIVFLRIIQVDFNNAKWHDGICLKDNTHWQYSNSTTNRFWRCDYYICDNGHVIELINDYEIR